MGLTNTQYDTLMRQYNARQLKSQRVVTQRKDALYAAHPQLKEIEQEIAHLSVEKARALLSQNSDAAASYEQQLAVLYQTKKELFEALSLPDDYLTPPYECPDCKDTGFINGRRCHCFKQAAIDLVYTQSNMKKILQEENFSQFSFDYYSQNEIDDFNGRSVYDTAVSAVTAAKKFIADFDNKFENMFLFGNTGVGKTFLSNCIAKELLDTGHSVVYLTAFQLFDIFQKRAFEKDETIILEHQNIFDCDLLIIDDLGTENTGAYKASQFFLCINERILRKKSTLISTNVFPNSIKDVYSERTASRIMSHYMLVHLAGSDIRIQKKLKKTSTKS
ncbi:MAG: ATP-binding protein [Lachnospiraceae bacterium]